MVVVYPRLAKLHFSMHYLELVNGRLVDARLTTPSLIGCQCHLNIGSCAELYTSNDVTAQARNRC